MGISSPETNLSMSLVGLTGSTGTYTKDFTGGSGAQDFNFFFFFFFKSQENHWYFHIFPHSTRLYSQEFKLFSQPCLTPELIFFFIIWLVVVEIVFP